jgi:hypothetical protein
MAGFQMVLLSESLRSSFPSGRSAAAHAPGHPELSIATASFAHRRKPGLCPHCSYDLRPRPIFCPECGHIRNVSPATALFEPMKRWIFNILCFLSFSLFICFLFLWIWTQSNDFSLQRHFNSRKQDVIREYTFKAVAGRLVLDFDVTAHSYTEPSGLYEIVQWSHRTTHA